VNFKWKLSRGASGNGGKGHAPEDYSGGRQSCGEVLAPSLQWSRLILWFVALLFGDSQGKTRLFGGAALTLAVGSELYRYGLLYLGAEPSGILKLTMLLPFVWLLLESKKKLVPGK